MSTTGIILRGKLILQLESSDESCKQLPLILPQDICSTLSISLCRAQPLSWSACTKAHPMCARGIPLLEITSTIAAKSFIIAQNIVLHRDGNIYETHMLFLFSFIFFKKHKQAKTILGNHPFPTASFSSPHITWEICSSWYYFQKFHDNPEEFPAAKKHQLYWLATYFLTWIQMHSSLSFSITAGRAAFFTPSFHALQDVLLHCSDRTETALHGHPEHPSFNITSTALHQKHWGCKEKPLRTQGIQPLEWRSGGTSSSMATAVTAWEGRALQDGNCMFKSRSVFHKHPYWSNGNIINCLCLSHEHHLCPMSHTETTFVPLSSEQETAHSTKSVKAHC